MQPTANAAVNYNALLNVMHKNLNLESAELTRFSLSFYKNLPKNDNDNTLLHLIDVAPAQEKKLLFNIIRDNVCYYEISTKTLEKILSKLNDQQIDEAFNEAFNSDYCPTVYLKLFIRNLPKTDLVAATNKINSINPKFYTLIHDGNILADLLFNISGNQFRAAWEHIKPHIREILNFETYFKFDFCFVQFLHENDDFLDYCKTEREKLKPAMFIKDPSDLYLEIRTLEQYINAGDMRTSNIILNTISPFLINYYNNFRNISDRLHPASTTGNSIRNVLFSRLCETTPQEQKKLDSKYIFFINYKYRHIDELKSNIKNVFHNYANPTGGWFLSLHWNRHHVDAIPAFLVQLERAENFEEIKRSLMSAFFNAGNKTPFKSPTELMRGSFGNRMKFCFSMIDRYHRLAMEADHSVTPAKAGASNP